MVTRVSLSEAKANLSAVVDDVRRGSARYVIQRHGKPAAAIVSVEELAKLEGLERADRKPAGFLALVGLWGDVDDAEIDKFLEDVYRSRAEDLGRPVNLDLDE